VCRMRKVWWPFNRWIVFGYIVIDRKIWRTPSMLSLTHRRAARVLMSTSMIAWRRDLIGNSMESRLAWSMVLGMIVAAIVDRTQKIVVRELCRMAVLC